jgi:hypothetical protein
MDSSGNAVNIVILDACCNVQIFLAPVQAEQGSFIIYSTAPGETAVDGTDPNSPFVAAVVSLIAHSGVPVEVMFREVRHSVLASTDSRHGTPRISKRHFTLFRPVRQLSVPCNRQPTR